MLRWLAKCVAVVVLLHVLFFIGGCWLAATHPQQFQQALDDAQRAYHPAPAAPPHRSRR